MYAVRRTVYDAFIFLNRRERYPVDKNNLFLQRRFRCYCFMPHLAWVDDGYSDAQGVPCTHWYIRDSMALGGDRMKAVERRTAAIIPSLETGNLERSVRKLLTNTAIAGSSPTKARHTTRRPLRPSLPRMGSQARLGS